MVLGRQGSFSFEAMGVHRLERTQGNLMCWCDWKRFRLHKLAGLNQPSRQNSDALVILDSFPFEGCASLNPSDKFALIRTKLVKFLCFGATHIFFV